MGRVILMLIGALIVTICAFTVVLAALLVFIGGQFTKLRAEVLNECLQALANVSDKLAEAEQTTAQALAQMGRGNPYN